MIKKAIFPVGGLGTRFLPATKAMPKEMLPVVDKPLIQYAVEEAAEAGVEEFIFVTGRNKTAIEDHFDHSSSWRRPLPQRARTRRCTWSRTCCKTPDRSSMSASSNLQGSAMRSGARAILSVPSRLPFSLPTT